MIRFSADAKGGKALEQEVDDLISAYNDWFREIQAVSNAESGERVSTDLSGAEVATIKTFLGYHLGVGGHYAPPEETKDAEKTSS